MTGFPTDLAVPSFDWWHTDAGDFRWDEEHGLHSHFCLQFSDEKFDVAILFCDPNSPMVSVEGWKGFWVLHYKTVKQTQLQFVTFTQVLISSVCFNSNHSYVLLIHCSIQKDKQIQYKTNTAPINFNAGYNFFFFFSPPEDFLLLIFFFESIR